MFVPKFKVLHELTLERQVHDHGLKLYVSHLILALVGRWPYMGVCTNFATKAVASPKVEGSNPATDLNAHFTKDEHFEILDVPMVKSTTVDRMSFQLQKFITNFRNFFDSKYELVFAWICLLVKNHAQFSLCPHKFTALKVAGLEPPALLPYIWEMDATKNYMVL